MYVFNFQLVKHGKNCKKLLRTFQSFLDMVISIFNNLASCVLDFIFHLQNRANYVVSKTLKFLY